MQRHNWMPSATWSRLNKVCFPGSSGKVGSPLRLIIGEGDFAPITANGFFRDSVLLWDSLALPAEESQVILWFRSLCHVSEKVADLPCNRFRRRFICFHPDKRNTWSHEYWPKSTDSIGNAKPLFPKFLGDIAEIANPQKTNKNWRRLYGKRTEPWVHYSVKALSVFVIPSKIPATLLPVKITWSNRTSLIIAQKSDPKQTICLFILDGYQLNQGQSWVGTVASKRTHPPRKKMHKNKKKIIT